MTYGSISSARGFYVGDICYALNDRIYDELWGDELEYKDGVHTVPDDSLLPGSAGFSFAVSSTAYGDGVYRDQKGRKYCVDAGVIGAIPLELVDPEKNTYGGHVFKNPGICEFREQGGMFTIELPGERISIHTADASEPWKAYCQYLREWADAHDDMWGMECISPANYEEFLENEYEEEFAGFEFDEEE